MSILIKGMAMPKNCAECPFRQIRYSSLGKIMDCGIFGGTVGSFYKDDYDVRNIRHPKCPLEEIPFAEPEIIRCKDCKYRGKMVCPFGIRRMPRDNDFCFYGKRREE